MADSSVQITAGSGTPIRVLTGLGAGVADQQVVTLADSAGNLLGTAAAPIPAKLGDGTNSPAVKAASTAAAATDPALVIAFSPNSALPGGSALIGHVGITDLNHTVGMAVKAASTAAAAADPAAVVALSPNSPLPSGTNFAGRVQLTDGTNNSGVAAASTAALVAHPAQVVALSPNSPVPAGTNAIGTVVPSPIVAATATNTVAVNATPGATGTIGHAAATITAAVTTAAAFIAAPGAGLSIYITDVNVTNSGASGTLVSLFTAGQAVPLVAKYVAATTSAPPTSLRTPIRVGTATALNYTNSVASTSVFVQVTYYIAA